MTDPETTSRAGRGTVQTVTGAVRTDDLGVLLFHEHVVSGEHGVLLDSRVDVDWNHVISRALDVLADARTRGVRTVVDATTIEMNRDPALLRDLSAQSGVRIVMTAGLHTESTGFPAHFRSLDVEGLTEVLTHEVLVGARGTNIRAGVLKLAISEKMTDVERRMLSAVARAQVATGVPIITHTSGGSGVEQAKTLVGEGADPARTVIGHVDHKRSSWGYLEAILKTGVNIGFDRVGSQIFLKDVLRASLVAGVVNLGWRDRLFLSMDSCASWLGERPALMRDLPQPMVHLFDNFRVLLADQGVDEGTFLGILQDNPARLFTPPVPADVEEHLA